MNTSIRLKPLPVLPVERDEYCSQEMTDAIITELENKHKDTLQNIIENEFPVRADFHGKGYEIAIGTVIHEIGRKLPVPETDLGCIDLAYELGRRIRKAMDLPDTPTEGWELQQIHEYILHNKLTLDHQTAKEILQSYYEAKPDLWYAYAEALRHDQMLNIGAKYRDGLTSFLSEKYPSLSLEKNQDFYLQLSAMLTVMNACGIPLPEMG
ncbi:MAG: hypothetical protein H6858_08570 [Rhodospirillales bacterium]|nr:hypothetical protein [Alphaproteobacteria bacterium]MCB1838717.1 hypothetical protein [Alphaproteobacteria bacterium]MCB9977635.1 hypothetical protein [Rhodospirillales bacterium]